MPIVIEGVATNSQSLNTTTHTVPIPTGTAAGDILVAVYCIDGTPTLGNPSGWTKIGEVTESGGPGHKVAAWFKVAGASESATTFSTSASEESIGVVYRISGGDSGTAPEWATQDGAGDTGDPDPPNLTPSWGSAENAWIAFAGTDGGVEATGEPAGYLNNLEDNSGGSGGVGGKAASKVATGSSDNPGTFSGSGTEWAAVTIAVRPSTGGGGGGGGSPEAFSPPRRRRSPLLAM